MQPGYSDARAGGRLRQVAALVRYRLRSPGVFARVKADGFERVRAALLAHRGHATGPGRMLEIGAGQWLSTSKAFAMLNWQVTAVEPEAPPQALSDLRPFLRAVGPERALKTALGELVLRRAFEAHFLAHTGLAIRHAQVDVLRTGGESLPLPDRCVDVVVSENVFEHLPDVGAVVKELARVTRPGGLAYIAIHPFAALSGGHHPSTFHHGSAGDFAPTIPPWDHLRERRHPSGVYLNGLRSADYRRALEGAFETLRWDTRNEGESLLTEAIEAELADFSREELLTGKIVFVGRRRASS